MQIAVFSEPKPIPEVDYKSVSYRSAPTLPSGLVINGPKRPLSGLPAYFTKTKNRPQPDRENSFAGAMAEAVGFEPTVEFPLR